MLVCRRSIKNLSPLMRAQSFSPTSTVLSKGREPLEPELDAIVVGANVAGACTARNLSQRGLRVALVERQPGPEVGTRSCGDGIERYQFEKLGIKVPRGEFILREVPVAYLYSPDRRTRFRGFGAGIAIDRFPLNQHLLAQAVDAGVELVDSTEAQVPLLEDGRVVGIQYRSRHGGDSGRMHAPVTVDATGWRGQLRRAMPADWPIAEAIPTHETAIAYREERRRGEPVDELLVEATLDYEISPNGVYWMADRSETLVNVGIGMQRVPGVPNPRSVIRGRVLPLYPGLEGTEVIRSGGGIIPNRRPIDCPVANGLIAVGDAACQVNPLTGSGIGASMYASDLAAEAVTVALEATRTPSTEDLFPYARSYQTGYGRDQAAYQVLRLALQALTNDQLNRLMGSDTISEEDLVTAARTGKLALSFGAKMKAATKLMGEPRLFRALARMQRRMEAARQLYSNYPEHPEGLEGWRARGARLFGGR